MDRLDIVSGFVAVAETGSFIAASRRLGRSPAAVTRAVAALEHRLATRLFDGTCRAVEEARRQAMLERGHRARDGGRRTAEPARSGDEAARFGHRDKAGNDVEPIHLLFRLMQ